MIGTRCECGCGVVTTIYKGRPRRFVAGHHARGSNNSQFGLPRSQSTKEKISEVRKSQGSPWWVGRKHTDESKSQISARRSGVPTTPRLGREVPCEVCKKPVYIRRSEEGLKRFCSRHCMGIGTATGDLNPFFGKRHTRTTKEKIRQSTLAQRSKAVVLPTKPERMVHAELRSRQIEFLTEHPIKRWCVDVWVPSLNLIIFVDGCYWHSCPIHAPNGKKNHSDRARVPCLTKDGYKVAILWEHDILSNTQQCVQEVLSSCS